MEFSTASRCRQKGIGLVEIMVGLVVSSLLLGGLLQIFSSNKEVYVLQGEMSRLQENGRFAFHFLTRDLRMAGYFGCKRDLNIRNNLNDAAALEYNFGGDPIMAFHAGTSNWSPALPGELSGLDKPPLPGNDVVVIRRASGPSVNLRSPYRDSANPANTLVESGHDFEKSDIVVISDCTHATVVQITGASGSGGGGSASVTHNTGASVSPGNNSKALGHNYGAGSSVARIQSIAYYVAEGVNGPALFRRVGNSPGEELVDGLDQMKISYGLDTDGDGRLDEYKDEITVSERPEVLTIRINLLLVGQRSNMVQGEQSLVVNGQAFSSDDGRMRYVMASTITVRNRAP